MPVGVVQMTLGNGSYWMSVGYLLWVHRDIDLSYSSVGSSCHLHLLLFLGNWARGIEYYYVNKAIRRRLTQGGSMEDSQQDEQCRLE